MRTSKGLAMVCLVLAVAAGVVVASLTVPSNAAVVNGVAISRTTLNNDLSIISKSPAMQCFLLADQALMTGLPLAASPLSGAGVQSGSLSGSHGLLSIPDPATYSSAFTAYWLNQMVTAQLLEQRLAADGSPITPYALARARGILAVEVDQTIADLPQLVAQQHLAVPPQCPTSTQSLYRTVPAGFVDRMVVLRAVLGAYQLAAAGKSLTERSVAAYYAAHRSDFDRVCLVLLPVQTQAEAQQVAQAVAAGNSFESVASQNGGTAGCAPPALSSAAQVAAGLPIGELSAPIPAGNSGYLLIQRASTTPQPLKAVQDQVVQAMIGAAGSVGGAKVAELQRDSHVWVDPRYGRWVPAPVFSVEPWNGVGPQNLLCPQANVTVMPQAKAVLCPPTPATGAITTTISPPGTRSG